MDTGEMSDRRKLDFFDSWTSSPETIYGAGVGEDWQISEGGGLLLIGFQPGAAWPRGAVGANARELFAASGDEALAAFEAVVGGVATRRDYVATYLGVDGEETRWHGSIFSNGAPGSWHFHATLIPTPDVLQVAVPTGFWPSIIHQGAEQTRMILGLPETTWKRVGALVRLAALLIVAWGIKDFLSNSAASFDGGRRGTSAQEDGPPSGARRRRYEPTEPFEPSYDAPY